jgi:hypothetical protein
MLVLNAHPILIFFIFMHLHLESHLGTLGEPRDGHDVGAKPEDGVSGTSKMGTPFSPQNHPPR